MADNSEKTGSAPAQIRPWLWGWGIRSWLFIGIIGAIVVIWLIYARAHTVLIPLILAIIIGILLEPVVNFLTAKAHFPRWLATTVTVLLILAVIVGFFAIVVYGITSQSHQLAKQVQNGEAKLKDWLGHAKLSNSFVNWLSDAIKKIWPSISDGLTRLLGRTASGLGSFAIGAFIGFFILIFILGDDGTIKEFVAGHLGVPKMQGASILTEVASSFRGYFRGATMVAAVNAIVVIPVALILRLPLVGAITLVTATSRRSAGT